MIVGSYAVLRMGTFHEESKGMVPLEVWTFFAQEDLVVETGPLDPGVWAVPDGDDSPVEQCKFRTTCAEARRRASARGIDIDVCRKLYERFRPTARWASDVGEHGSFVVWEPSFDEFLDILRRPSSAVPSYEWQRSRDQYQDDDPPRWWDEWWEVLEEPEYEDAAFLLYLRCVIEVLPDDALVELDITDLVGSGYIDKA